MMMMMIKAPAVQCTVYIKGSAVISCISKAKAIMDQ